MKIRGFESVKDFDNLFSLPKRQTGCSAGYDIYLNQDYSLKKDEEVQIFTGVKAYMQSDEVLEIYIRSSLALKGLKMKNYVGIIDSDYYGNPKNDGEIILVIKNLSSHNINFKRGDRIAQGIFKKYLVSDQDEEILKKRDGGFGSTNQKES